MPANIEQNIKKIRELFEEELIDAYIIPHEDEFLTEYVPDHSERLAFITGFSGSAGLAIITKNKAAIFVDGRYTTQVKIQTSGKIFDHENLNYSDIEKWIKLNLKETSEIGFCPMTISLEKFNSFKNSISDTKIKFKKIDNLVDKLWLKKPKQNNSLIYKHNKKFIYKIILCFNGTKFFFPGPKNISPKIFSSSCDRIHLLSFIFHDNIIIGYIHIMFGNSIHK